MKTLLRKIKWNKGKTENGQEYDYTRLYIEVPVYEHQEKEFGVDVVELEFGKSEQHSELINLRGKLPCLVEVEFSPVKKGNNTVNLVTKLQVLQNEKPKTAQS
ncbi:hypothetical protein JF634_10135 [Simonsiella muelleri]|uniref:Uncharacterized protein n=1 Tax=Simonsiella muelleri ATCC 29453 TaxID=641147 RepID=U6Q1D2_9NEIS|nr:hypothetical protein [Simonsiella muelleri]AUX60989.1 hypothetical protein BWP33_03580 [Simonsiella muelleri ATCC 29453]AUX61233.1 hypothetical protein BWP33_05000 [Simonsiella muelleri ATCC 29453]EFG29832.1 hypothetical protein HMPREF9021_02325 [Simonsiella muelleri ATCC 29453]EJZ50108.1 hypothetical protein HMPREF9021_02652 [Simonsiella muelleri ATCC 29453]UBQ53034.1 hypothetical protein JF634_07375 [Simonsiella muelleri]